MSSPILQHNRLWYRFNVNEWIEELQALSNELVFETNSYDQLDDLASILSVKVLRLRDLLIKLGQCWSRDRENDILRDIVEASESILVKIGDYKPETASADADILLMDLSAEASRFIDEKPSSLWRFISFIPHLLAKLIDYCCGNQSENLQTSTNLDVAENKSMFSTTAKIAKMPVVISNKKEFEVNHDSSYSLNWRKPKKMKKVVESISSVEGIPSPTI